MGEEARWRLRFTDGDSAPLPASIVKSLIAKGKADERTLVCLTGDSMWRELVTVPELKAALVDAKNSQLDVTSGNTLQFQTNAILQNILEEILVTNKKLAKVQRSVRSIHQIGGALLIIVCLFLAFGGFRIVLQ
jgi:hypothetical protein